MITFYDNQTHARADAAARQLREKVMCFVVRGNQLLVFDHVPPEDAGVQVVAGGVEANETPEAAASRELHEESGLSLKSPAYLVSYLWEAQLPDRFTRQVCHAYAFTAPHDTPESWEHVEKGQYGEFLFRFRWANLNDPGLDWEMDAALPALKQELQRSNPSVACGDSNPR